MNAKVTGIVSYITIIGWLVAFFVGDKAGAKFHLNQSLVLNVLTTALWIVGFILGFIPFIGTLIKIIGCILFLANVACIVFLCIGQDLKLPVAGEINIL